MEEYFALLNPKERQTFTALAEAAFQLGYKAKKDKTHSLAYTFRHSKIKPLILRFVLRQGKPVLKLKYFAASTYSRYFHEAIRRTIEEYNYRYTGCYGCGKCDGTQGYHYTYPDGRQYYYCGSELIELTDIENLPLQEALLLLQTQHQAYLATPPAE